MCHVLFALTILLSSTLLFLLQPMFGRMVLPLLGGTPAVWNTCLVFYQVALLAGYAYAHFLPRWLGTRPHAVLHLALMVAAISLLPVSASAASRPPTESLPVFWLLGVLIAALGLPFFVIAANSTLLQKWYVAVQRPAQGNPYFLYSFSNLGSMIALFGYPLILEQLYTLGQQSQRWKIGYLALVGLLAVCILPLWSKCALSAPGSTTGSESPKPKGIERLRWLALAFVPTSLMVSVTTYLTTDVAAVPLLWVIPLAIFLLSFILVFARRTLVPHYAMVRIQPLLILLLALVMLSEATALASLPVFCLFALHLLVLFDVAMVCHGELARTKPPAEHLTEFYLWMATGGALGGLFTSLLAPLLFSSLVEYPLALVLACVLRPEIAERAANHVSQQLDLVLPLLLGLGTLALVLGAQSAGLEAGQVSVAVMFAGPAAACYTFMQRPLRFGLGIGALLLAGSFYHGVHGKLLYRERSFFGIHRVTEDARGRFHALVHGNTVHGLQSQRPKEHDVPLTYYHPTGPIGQVFAAFSGANAKARVAVVGLGAGSLAAYGATGQRFTYFEIDPAVARIAADMRYFTFLRDTQAAVDIVLGDARLTLADAPARQFGILVIDAFSSDAIPLHLITVEAVQLYLAKMQDDGLLAFHVSNRYLDLPPVLAGIARAQQLVCWGQDDLELSDAEREAGKYPSRWVIMARHKDHLGRLSVDVRWREITPDRRRAWTDDYSNLLEAFQWD